MENIREFGKSHRVISPNKLLGDQAYKQHLLDMINELASKYDLSKEDAALAISNTFKRIIDEI